MNIEIKKISDDSFSSVVEALNIPRLLDKDNKISPNGPWISGGVARCLWFDKPWKEHDIDIFFQSKNQLDEIKEKLQKLHDLSTKISEGFNELESAMKASQPFLSVKKAKSMAMPHHTNNASTFRLQLGCVWPNTIAIQLIKKAWHSSIPSLWSGFDFNVCKFATDGRVVIADRSALVDCQDNILRRNESTASKINPRRAIKYSIYGFDLDPTIMEEIIEQYRDKTINDGDDDDY